VSPEERLELIRFDDVTSCIRRQVWEEFPLPERNYGEDMAWAKAVLLSGHMIAYTPEARVWHTHERGPIYELRRAYIDGYTRVQLVDWPAMPLRMGDVVALVRRTMFCLRTKRFDSMVEPEAARRFLLAEMHHYEPLVAHRPAQIYMRILRFAMGLTNRAASLCPEGVFPEKAWVDLFRFATVAIVGQTLGATAAGTMNQYQPAEEVVWRVLHRLLGRSI
jgi:hypothetical protein